MSIIAQLLLLGVCHKCLRVLAPIHFAAAFLNPGFGRIPDINKYLPWDKQWFKDGIDSATYQVTHKCIKNSSDLYFPQWLTDGNTIKDEVIALLAKRLPEELPPPPPPLSDSDDSEDDLGPNLSHLHMLGRRAPGVRTGVQQATAAIRKYEAHSKGYVTKFSYHFLK